MTKYDMIDARELFDAFDMHQVTSMSNVISFAIESFTLNAEVDSAFDGLGLYGYQVHSFLNRAYDTLSTLDVVMDCTYQYGDLMLSSDNMVLLINDLIFAFDCYLDIIFDIAQESDCDDRVKYMTWYGDCVRAQRILEQMR